MSQRISVCKYISESERQVYNFFCFDFNIVFVSFAKESKKPRKRIWNIDAFWDKYNSRDSKLPEPELPLGIRTDAMNQAKNMIQIKTWKEYKGE